MFLMDLAEIASLEAGRFCGSGKRAICVVGGGERKRYLFCDLMRKYFPNNYVFPNDFGAGEMDAFIIDLSNYQEAA